MHRLIIALVTLIGLAGAAFLAGYLLLFSATADRAAALAPAETDVYVNIYLQPSAGQQMNLGGLIGRLPGFADEASLDEKIDQVVGNLLASSGIELDYRTQIKPWLGSQVALAAWATDTEPGVVAIIDVKDVDAAGQALEDLAGDPGLVENYKGVEIRTTDDGAYALVDDFLVMSETAANIEAVVDVRNGAASLSGRSEYSSAMSDLPSDHLASAFVDIVGIAEATDMGQQLSAFSTAGATLVAERDGLRLSGHAPFDVAGAASSATAGFGLGGEPSSLVDWMPQDTIAELVVFGLRQTLEDAEAAAATTPEGQELVSGLDTFRALASFGLGIDVDADLLPLLDREVGVALSGLDGDLPRGQLLLRPEDPAAGEAALRRVVERLTVVGATARTEMHESDEITALTIPATIELAYAVRDGIIIIGTGVEDVIASLDAHAGGDTLASAADYVRAFEVAGSRAGNEGFVDVSGAIELMGGAVDLPADARDILSRIGTLGFTAPSRDDQIEFHAVLTVDEP